MLKSILEEKLTVSTRFAQLPIYVFAEIAELKKTLDQNWLIDLSLGSPDSPTPEPIVQSLIKNVKNTENHGYPRFNGKESLVKKITQWANKRFNININSSHVLPLLGSKEGLAHLPLVYLNPGDLSIIPDPHYPVHYRSSIVAGAEIYDLKLKQENNFLPDLSSIPEHVAERAKLIIISYPNNPTGAVATPEFMKEIVNFCRKYNILLCHDLTYSELAFTQEKPKSIFEYMSLDEPAIEFFTFSKTYHMAGWRIGFCIGNQKVIENLYTLKTNLDYGIFGAIQDAASDALDLPESYYAQVTELYKNRAEFVHRELTEKLGWDILKPQGAMYMWIPVPKNYNGDSTEFSLELLRKIGIVVTPGVAFGNEGKKYVRIALVQPEEKLREACDRIINYFKK